MFLNKVIKENSRLIDEAVKLHQENKILPDTFVVDVDQFVKNAKTMYEEACKHNIELYYMLKQLGRNPYLAKLLEDIGYKGAVVVDYKEAEVMMRHGLKIAHIGHLVQIPKGMIDKAVKYGCEYITVYSAEKIKEIDVAAKKYGKVQKLMIKAIDEDDTFYSGQYSGFYTDELEKLVRDISGLQNVEIAGVDAFPCFLYDEEKDDIESLNNLKTLFKAKKILEDLGCNIVNVNAPSSTCTHTILKMKDYPFVKSLEPGHGLSATTPYHARHDTYEKQCVVYLSEISHCLNGMAYYYGGGYYRRGHIENALVINEKRTIEKVILPNIDSIDYYLGLKNKFPVGSSVVMAFRFQAFVCRSDICLIEGLSKDKPEIIGLYNGLGDKK